MADDPTPSEDTQDQDEDLWLDSAEEAPELFINLFRTDVDTSEVTLLLGSSFYGRKRQSSCKARLVMTHHGFVEFAKYIERQGRIIEEVYGGAVPSFEDFSDEHVNAAIDSVDQEAEKT